MPKSLRTAALMYCLENDLASLLSLLPAELSRSLIILDNIGSVPHMTCEQCVLNTVSSFDDYFIDSYTHIFLHFNISKIRICLKFSDMS